MAALAKKHLRVNENSAEVTMVDPFLRCRAARVGPLRQADEPRGWGPMPGRQSREPVKDVPGWTKSGLVFECV